MTMRAPVAGGARRWQMRRSEIVSDIEFQQKCLKLWDRGHDTHSIAHIVFQPEYVVDQALRIAREQRRQNEQ
ncbi:MAG: hypothetical protein C5B60_07835 [Chloroflexi bacterium]|nr:MAG: hypothetical protein C5B60_07835 [Chloroflexota bacterium]